MNVRLKRAYDPVEDGDGVRILVDRLWPRGVRKAALQLDGWAKELAPSRSLRQWFAHDPDKWDEFRNHYLGELNAHHQQITDLLSGVGTSTLTLIYAARDAEHNHAIILKEYLESIAGELSG